MLPGLKLVLAAWLEQSFENVLVGFSGNIVCIIRAKEKQIRL